jgi:hypothetical protein
MRHITKESVDDLTTIITAMSTIDHTMLNGTIPHLAVKAPVIFSSLSSAAITMTKCGIILNTIPLKGQGD